MDWQSWDDRDADPDWQAERIGNVDMRSAR